MGALPLPLEPGMTRFRPLAALALLFSALMAPGPAVAASAHDFAFTAIEGGPLPLSAVTAPLGDRWLVVGVASR